MLPFDSGQPECATGDIASTTTVALIGDSHAAMFNPAFQQVAEQRHWRLEMMAKAGCPITDLPITNRFNGLAEEIQRCAQWRTQIVARLRAERPQLIVVSCGACLRRQRFPHVVPGLKMYDQAWIDSLTRLVQQLRETGAKVLVLGPTADPPAPVPLCLSGHLDDVTACAAVRRRGHTDPASQPSPPPPRPAADNTPTSPTVLHRRTAARSSSATPWCTSTQVT